MIKQISIVDFLHSGTDAVLIDVRTPSEYAHGHVPGAFNLPLFSDAERVAVGTTYKQVGREAAILLGFDLAGPKWSGFIQEALKIAPGKKIVVHCWRGGMRSGTMAWALDLYGFDVSVITGGYKHYRNSVQQQFTFPYRLAVLGGMTGSGKTRILHQMQLSGEQVVDLEDLAQHQGSSYGSMNKLVQPTQEQFENNLAGCLMTINPGQRLWVEDESLSIGKRSVPKAFWLQLRAAILVEVQVPREERIASLVQEYGNLDEEFMAASTERLRKRLGPEQTKHGLEALRDRRLADFIRLVLVYYDKTYRKGLTMRDAARIYPVSPEGKDAAAHAQQILTFALSLIPLTE